MERANLKERRKDVYERLVAKWLDWNAKMLPEVDESNTGNFHGMKGKGDEETGDWVV